MTWIRDDWRRDRDIPVLARDVKPDFTKGGIVQTQFSIDIHTMTGFTLPPDERYEVTDIYFQPANNGLSIIVTLFKRNRP